MLKRIIICISWNKSSIEHTYNKESWWTMILEYKVDELSVQGAWLKTLYDLIEELNCKCQTFMEEKYNTNRNCFAPVRVVKIFGSNTLLNWLKLRMERYNHFVDSLNSQDVFCASFLDEENEV